MKSPITTHVLDTSTGKPAQGVHVVLELREHSGDWNRIAEGVTDADGRITNLLGAGHRLEAGSYRLTFHTAEYFRGAGVNGFYPYVQVVFEIKQPQSHYHIPLLLSPYGYSTYRGS